jgi:hypothetical protein
MSLGRKHRRPDPPQLPRTLEEAVQFLLERVPSDELDEVRRMNEGEVLRETGVWQQGIRNDFGMWGENRALLDSFPESDRWPDAASALIVMAVWRRLNGAPPGST